MKYKFESNGKELSLYCHGIEIRIEINGENFSILKKDIGGLINTIEYLTKK